MKPAPPSRLLVRLDERIAAATLPVEADCLRAERAGYLARQGRLEEARSIVSEIQQRYARHPQVEVSAWVSLAEGLISHFSDMGALAHDKMRRSHVLSVAASLVDIRAVSAAWVAQLDYARGDIAGMVRHVLESFDVARPSHHSARSRACFVIGQAYHYAGQLGLAMPWYEQGRQHVVDDGDELTLSASMYNMAWLRAANLRQSILHPSSCIDEMGASHALLSANSTLSFESLVGSVSLSAMGHILKAQILSVSGRPAEALSLYEEHLPLAIEQGSGWLEAALLSDKAWCRLQIDRSEDAEVTAAAEIERAEAVLQANGQAGDIAPAHSRIAQVHQALGNREYSEKHSELARMCWHAHIEVQKRMTAALKLRFSVPAPVVAASA